MHASLPSIRPCVRASVRSIGRNRSVGRRRLSVKLQSYVCLSVLPVLVGLPRGVVASRCRPALLTVSICLSWTPAARRSAAGETPSTVDAGATIKNRNATIERSDGKDGRLPVAAPGRQDDIYGQNARGQNATDKNNPGQNAIQEMNGVVFPLWHFVREFIFRGAFCLLPFCPGLLLSVTFCPVVLCPGFFKTARSFPRQLGRKAEKARRHQYCTFVVNS